MDKKLYELKLYKLLIKYENGELTEKQVLALLTQQEINEFIELLRNQKGGYIPQ